MVEETEEICNIKNELSLDPSLIFLRSRSCHVHWWLVSQSDLDVHLCIIQNMYARIRKLVS